MCYHVAMVTDIGDYTEVQVVTVTSKLATTVEPTVTHTLSLDPDRGASRELSRKFLEEVRKALSPGK